MLAPFLVILETLAIVIAVALLWRRSRSATPPFGRRLALIAFLLVAQAFLFIATARPTPGLVAVTDNGPVAAIRLGWLPQLLRAGLLLAAAALWLGISRGSLNTRARRIVLLLSCVAIAYGEEPLPFFGFLGLVWLTNRMEWPKDVSGWRRFVVLLLTLPLFVAILMQPMSTGTAQHARVGYGVGLNFWSPPDPLADTVPRGLATELRLALPFDRIARVALTLFGAQLLTLFGQLLLLPVGLRGMSLRRRFTINYFFIRLVPSALSTIVLLLVVYLGFGLYKVGRVRAEFDGTLDRALSVASWLAQDGDDPAQARRWLGPDSTTALIVLRGPGGDVTRADTGARPTIPASSVFARASGDSLKGLVESGGNLYLAAQVRRPGRAGAPPQQRPTQAGAPPQQQPAPGAPPDSLDRRPSVEVLVPLDSLYLGRAARLAGTDIRVTAFPNLYMRSTTIEAGHDSTWLNSKIVVAARFNPVVSGGGLNIRRFFLGRAFLPAGPWGTRFTGDLRGAVQLTLDTCLNHFRAGLGDAGGILVSNAYTILLIVGIMILIAITESLAVRIGRGIIKALLDEMVSLRDAAARIGSGDLDHRIPVRGEDEISSVAGSFNEMAANLKRQQQELLEKERLEADLAVAREIQQRLLPQGSPVIPGLDVAGLSVPSKEIGGDLFYFLPLEGGRLGLALGDVAGKSVPAALLMSNVLAVLRAEAQFRAEVDVSLARINRLIAEQIEPGRFVTLFYGMIDRAQSVIHYASAGHNPTLKVSAAGQVTWLSEAGLPLGVLPETTYPMASVPLEPGDVLVIYSDGITEAMGMKPEVAAAVARGERQPPEAGVAVAEEMDFFEDERLVATVLALRDRRATDILAGVVDAVHAFARGVPQADDMTLVVVKVTGGGAG